MFSRFFVIFILMLCFGGCGYWRRRQILVSQQQAILQARSLVPGIKNNDLNMVFVNIKKSFSGIHTPSPCFFLPSRYNFRDIELKFCMFA